MRSRLSFRAQRGAAALQVVMLLFFAIGIVVAYANRSLVFEQRTSANQYRYTQAFEVAEAGLEWAVASLNNGKKIDAACAADPTGTTFKDRMLTIDPTTSVITPSGRQAACVLRADNTLACSCPGAGNPTATETGAAFKLELQAVAGQPGVVALVSHGCTSTGDASKDPRCLVGGIGASDAYAKVSVMLGLLPAVASAPAATITARHRVSWQGTGAALGVVNTDAASNGITINAGSAIDEAKARITTIPGSPPSSSIIANDPSLANMSPDNMFVTYFGMTKENYKSIATVLTCSGNCAGTLSSAYDAGARLLWVEGDMDLQSNVQLGTINEPVLLVVNGNITLNGTLDVVGLVYRSVANPTLCASSPTDPACVWDNTGGGSAFLRGAAVSEGGFTGNGTPDFFYDPNVLRRLTTTIGSFARIPGSWKDF